MRAWIEFADGSRDDTSVVAWLQLPSLMAVLTFMATAFLTANAFGWLMGLAS